MTTTSIERAPREFVRGQRSRLRVVVRGTGGAHDVPDPDAFIERLRCDAFGLYAAVREVQRERGLPVSERLRMLETAAGRAARIADAVDAWIQTAALDDERSFAVPV